tara:strand:+ start:1250 stop:1771 length:522 start_codon:yes stop_codon:yes gene_type:complete
MKRSEKRLLLGLLSLAVVGAGVVCSDIYFDRRDELRAEQSSLENEWIEIQTLFEEKEMWELRANWLEKNQPPYTSTESIAQSIFEKAQAKNVKGVTTSRQTLLPVDRQPHYTQAGVTLAAGGTLPDLFDWILELTPPRQFRVIKNLKLEPNPENPESLNARFDLLRWYAPPKQ